MLFCPCYQTLKLVIPALWSCPCEAGMWLLRFIRIGSLSKYVLTQAPGGHTPSHTDTMLLQPINKQGFASEIKPVRSSQTVLYLFTSHSPSPPSLHLVSSAPSSAPKRTSHSLSIHPFIASLSLAVPVPLPPSSLAPLYLCFSFSQ